MHQKSVPNSLSTFSNAALVLVGHGSTVNPDSSEPTLAHAAAIRKRGLFAEVVCGFWKEQPSLREVLYSVESQSIYIVPNFISEGYFTQKVIPRELGLQGRVTRAGDRTLYACDPVGNHEQMTQVLLERAAQVAPGIPTSEVSLLIVGHGTGLNDNSAKAAKAQVAKIRQTGLYAQVESAYMEEPPLISEWDQLAAAKIVVVVPFFISDGLHSYQDIPVLLGIREEIGPAASQSEVFSQNPHELRGKTLYYASAIGTHPKISQVIIDQVVAFDNCRKNRTNLKPGDDSPSPRLST